MGLSGTAAGGPEEAEAAGGGRGVWVSDSSEHRKSWGKPRTGRRVTSGVAGGTVARAGLTLPFETQRQMVWRFQTVERSQP